MSAPVLGPSGHVDTFTRDNLPPFEQWPDLLLDGFDYPEYLNAAVELTDRNVERGFGDHTALIGNGRRRTYKELSDWTNRLAHALTEDYGVVPGQRVLIRSANNPAMVACWLAATKAGAVAVNIMPMLRAGELSKIVDKAEVSVALCDTRLMDELVACAKESRFLTKVVGFDGTANHDAELDRVRARLEAALKLRGCRVWPSAANFLLVGAAYQTGALKLPVTAMASAVAPPAIASRARKPMPTVGLSPNRRSRSAAGSSAARSG